MAGVIPKTFDRSGLADFNKYLSTRSYVEGFKPSQADVKVYLQVPRDVPAVYAHINRWVKHISSFAPEARAKWPASEKKEEKEEKKVEAEAAEPSPFDEEPAAGNPFGDEEETEEEKERARIINERAAKKAAEDAAKGKKKEVARSTLILDVKPLGDETDMKKLEADVRAITMEGLRWAGSELVPVVGNVLKLRIISIIVDDLISTDELRETIEAFEDVQSTDIYAFNKV